MRNIISSNLKKNFIVCTLSLSFKQKCLHRYKLLFCLQPLSSNCCVCSELESQARKLINRIRGDSKVDFNNDWKVVTILSGNNDLCDVCNDRVRAAMGFPLSVPVTILACSSHLVALTYSGVDIVKLHLSSRYRTTSFSDKFFVICNIKVLTHITQ